MYAVSLALCNTAIMTVHNQYPDIELVSPAYFCNRGTYHEYPVKRMDNNTIMKISFRFDIDQDESSGILMYEAQRKGNTRFGHQSNVDPIYAKVIEEALKVMRLLVTWKVKRSWGPKVNIMLVEYDNGFALNEDKLAQLYEKANDIPSGCNLYGCAWLMCDNTTLDVTNEEVEKPDFESKITISEGFVNRHTIRSRWIDSERQVPSDMIIYFY
jgi:hypothetical protein